MCGHLFKLYTLKDVPLISGNAEKRTSATKIFNLSSGV